MGYHVSGEAGQPGQPGQLRLQCVVASDPAIPGRGSTPARRFVLQSCDDDMVTKAMGGGPYAPLPAARYHASQVRGADAGRDALSDGNTGYRRYRVGHIFPLRLLYFATRIDSSTAMSLTALISCATGRGAGRIAHTTTSGLLEFVLAAHTVCTLGLTGRLCLGISHFRKGLLLRLAAVETSRLAASWLPPGAAR